MRSLDLQPTGGRWGSITGLKQQMTRLFSSSVTCIWENKESTAIANMQAVTDRFGSAPLAFLVVPMVGAFFIDIANAIVIKLFLALPFFSG